MHRQHTHMMRRHMRIVETRLTCNDELGRRTSRSSGGSTTTYDWDATGHLAAVISSDTTVTFSYGASGMRELTVRESEGGTETTEHFWRGATLTAERFSDGTVHEYVYGPGGLPLEVVVRAPGQPAERYSYAVDGGGSVIGLVGDDAYSGLVASYRYGPYGEVEETWAASGHEDLAWRNPLRYRAYYYDTETGHYYLPARYYDPETMRFLSPDPASPSAGEPLSLNRYAYCVGDPVNLSDPSGAVNDLERDAWAHYYYSDPVTAGDRPAASAGTRSVHASADARRQAGTSAADAAAELAQVAAAAAHAERDRALARGRVFRDANFTWVGSRGVGVTAGYIQDTEAGAGADAHIYIGVALGIPGVSASGMLGPGRTDGGGCRYIELSSGVGAAGAAGFRSDNAGMTPWQFGQMYQHALDNGYWQAGGGTPPRPTVSWFVVL